MKTKFFLIAIIAMFFFVSAANAGNSVSYKSVNSMNEYIQVKNTGASTLGKGAPVVFEASEVATNGYLGVEGTTDTTAVIIGVLMETLEAEAVGDAIVYGIAEVLVDEAVDAGDQLGSSTTSGEADDNNTNVQAQFATTMELTSARGLGLCYIYCK